MADFDLDTARRGFAELTVLFEDAAQIASVGQGINSLDVGRCRFKRLSIAMDRIRRHLGSLEGRLQ